MIEVTIMRILFMDTLCACIGAQVQAIMGIILLLVDLVTRKFESGATYTVLFCGCCPLHYYTPSYG